MQAGSLVAQTAGALPDGNVTITGGTLQLAAGIGTTSIASLSISGSGVLDLSNNALILRYGSSDPISSIVALIKSGYNGGAWNGSGIISSAAQSPAGGLLYGVGYVDGKDHVVSGLSSGQIELMYTLMGDANLDGKVNGADFTIMATNFNQSGRSWDQGDFNYDGMVNGDDFVLLADNFNDFASNSSIYAADMAAIDSFAAANDIDLTGVPEPTAIALATLAIPLALHRRSRATTPAIHPRSIQRITVE